MLHDIKIYVALGGVILLLVYGLIFLRVRPSQTVIDRDFSAIPLTNLDPSTISQDFFAVLRGRDVNGELPVKVEPTETHTGEATNPFVAP